MTTTNTAKIFEACLKPTLWGGLVGLLLLFSSCTTIDLEDPLKGKVTLNTNWSNRTAGVEIPASYTVIINSQTLTYTKPSNQLPELSAATYPILIHNTADKIYISQTTATVAATNGIVEPMPGWLFTATTKAQYADFKEETITAVMQQQVRQLTLTLKPEGGTVDKIESISAQLSGIAGAWDLVTHLPTGNALSVPLVFVKQADGTWKATVRLLGIIGNEQKLSGTITFKDSMPSDMSLDSDLSADLSTFNTEKHKLLLLNGDVETQTEAGFSATIKAWKDESSGSGIAN